MKTTIIVRKICISLISILSLFVLSGCSPTTNIEALKRIKTISIPVKAVNLRPHKANLQSGMNYEYNLDPNCGLERRMLPVEKTFLNKKFEALDRALSSIDIKVKEKGNLTGILTLQDEHLYIPYKATYFDTTDIENIKKYCAANNVDALGVINIEFYKLFYDEPFVGSFIRMQARAKVKVFSASGEEILSREINGESKSKISQTFKLTVSIPVIGGTGLIYKKDLNFDNNSENRNYLLKSFNLRNNYGPLYEEAMNDLVVKMQQEMEIIKQNKAGSV